MMTMIKILRHERQLPVGKLAAEHQHMTAHIAAMRDAQDLLGRLHDLQVLLASGRDVQASLLPADFDALRDLESLADAIERDCRQLHARYVRDRVTLIAIADQLGEGKPRAVSAYRRVSA